MMPFVPFETVAVRKAALLLALVLACPTVQAQRELPAGTSRLFSGSGNCQFCHRATSSVMNWRGVDVSPITSWRSTMMGNASKDPLWRAMVAKEVRLLPALQATIESKCTRCHAPAGYVQAIDSGRTGYAMAELRNDPLANDGVTCTVCHQISPEGLGTPASYSGGFVITRDRLLYGPYEHSDSLFMPALIGYRARYGPHKQRSELCATCHTLITPTFDAQGNQRGTFPEQTPYLEWKNSVYPSRNVQCQDCHMPVLHDSIRIASQGNFPPRSPFWRHLLVGGNAYMLRMLRDNAGLLGVTAETAHFDSTIARTMEQLTERSVDLDVQTGTREDSLEVTVRLTNRAGHKLPSGIPIRRMWVHVVVEKAGGGVVFESGAWDGSGRIAGEDAGFEPHHNLITRGDQVQIYEGVTGDTEGRVTRSLLRSAAFLKDNRLPPQGFVASHPGYDSTAVYGDARTDPDFNRTEGPEGSGSDAVHYRCRVLPYARYRVTVEVCYQPVNPAVADHLRGTADPDIERFLALYDAAPNMPVVMRRQVLENVRGPAASAEIPVDFALWQNYPNPFNPATVLRFDLPVPSRAVVTVYNTLGQVVARPVDAFLPAGVHEYSLNAAGLASGIYLYRLEATGTGRTFSEARKMVLVR